MSLPQIHVSWELEVEASHKVGIQLSGHAKTLQLGFLVDGLVVKGCRLHLQVASGTRTSID